MVMKRLSLKKRSYGISNKNPGTFKTLQLKNPGGKWQPCSRAALGLAAVKNPQALLSVAVQP